jgi:hypothetical protein
VAGFEVTGDTLKINLVIRYALSILCEGMSFVGGGGLKISGPLLAGWTESGSP